MYETKTIRVTDHWEGQREVETAIQSGWEFVCSWQLPSLTDNKDWTTCVVFRRARTPDHPCF